MKDGMYLSSQLEKLPHQLYLKSLRRTSGVWRCGEDMRKHEKLRKSIVALSHLRKQKTEASFYVLRPAPSTPYALRIPRSKMFLMKLKLISQNVGCNLIHSRTTYRERINILKLCVCGKEKSRTNHVEFLAYSIHSTVNKLDVG